MSEAELPWWKTDKDKAMEALRQEAGATSVGNAKTGKGFDPLLNDQLMRPIEFATYQRQHYLVEIGRQGQDLVFHFFTDYPLIESDFFRHALTTSFEEAFRIENRLEFFFDQLVRCMAGSKEEGCGFRAKPQELTTPNCPECGSKLSMTFQGWTVLCHGFNNGYAEELASKALDTLDKKFGS